MTKKERLYRDMEEVKSKIDSLMNGILTPKGESDLKKLRKELVILTDSYRKSDISMLIFRIPKETKDLFKKKTIKDGTDMSKFIVEKINEYINA